MREAGTWCLFRRDDVPSRELNIIALCEEVGQGLIAEKAGLQEIGGVGFIGFGEVVGEERVVLCRVEKQALR